MLPQVTWQILNQYTKIEKFSNQRMAGVEAGIVELASKGVIGVFIFPGAYQRGQTIQGFRLNGKRFADLPSG